jgi:enamine deaminase RidA (YjgF/YER057c/UK114 family)
MLTINPRAIFLVSMLSGLVSTQTNADEVVRHKIPNSDFPISLAVEIPATARLVNLSGAVPPVTDSKADPKSIAAYGDTEMQTVTTLKSIENTLKGLGLSLGDVVKMQVYLVGAENNDAKMDYAGFMRGYTQFFGPAGQKNLPTRSVFQVAGLANPGYLVEIEVSAVRP